MAQGCINHISEGNQAENQSRNLELFMKHIFFFLSETANCLPVSSLHWWTIKHAADQELFSGTHLSPINTTPGGNKTGIAS